MHIYIYCTCRQLLASACVYAFSNPEVCVLLSAADHKDNEQTIIQSNQRNQRKQYKKQIDTQENIQIQRTSRNPFPCAIGQGIQPDALVSLIFRALLYRGLA